MILISLQAFRALKDAEARRANTDGAAAARAAS